MNQLENKKYSILGKTKIFFCVILSKCKEFFKTAKATLSLKFTKIRKQYMIYKNDGDRKFLAYIWKRYLLKRIQHLFTRNFRIYFGYGKRSVCHHIFVHSLVLDESKAFRIENDSTHDFESWFITKEEFITLLENLYKRGFVLVKLSSLLEGKIRLEKGKIPLVISFDDMNYYDYMKGYGFADKLDLSKTDESVTVLEAFIRHHPDFSHDDARGIIALTGYEGALGYRDTDSPELLALVQELKLMRYEFACHSWGHHHAIYSNTNPNGEKGIIDMEKWFAGVGKVIGHTDIFVTPFGVDIRNNTVLHRYLKSKGFRYFCSVGNICVQKCGQCFYMGRFNFDGVSMLRKNYDYLMYYCDPAQIYSKGRCRKYVGLGKNADSLVKHALFCLKIPTVYFWDGFGEVLTHRLLLAKRKMYPKAFTLWKCLKYFFIIDGEIRGFDCSGLIKSFLMGGLFDYKYNPKVDYNSKGLLENSHKKGDISTLPEIPGVCLYMQGHVGIYIGKGKVVESTSNRLFGNGVVKTNISDRKWEKWFYCPGIEYEDEVMQ